MREEDRRSGHCEKPKDGPDLVGLRVGEGLVLHKSAEARCGLREAARRLHREPRVNHLAVVAPLCFKGVERGAALWAIAVCEEGQGSDLIRMVCGVRMVGCNGSVRFGRAESRQKIYSSSVVASARRPSSTAVSAYALRGGTRAAL